MITVHKLRHDGVEKLAYTGEVVKRDESYVVLQAAFAQKQMVLPYVTLNNGDCFIEYFYSNRWYNVFAIFDVDNEAFKGWYCNITRPAKIEAEHVWADDLELDYFVQPGGNEFVLDQEEFDALKLEEPELNAAHAALAELKRLAARREGPFNLAEVQRLRSHQ